MQQLTDEMVMILRAVQADRAGKGEQLLNQPGQPDNQHT